MRVEFLTTELIIKVLLYLKEYVLKYKWKFILGSFFVILTNIFKVINPRIVKRAIDALETNFELSQIYQYAIMIVVISVLQGIFLFLMRKTIIVASREIEFDLRNDLLWKLEQLTSTFYNKMPTGDIMSRCTNDMNAVRSVLGPGIAYSINTIIAFLFVLPMMIYISPLLTFLALIPFPVMAIMVNRFGKAINVRYEKIQAQLAKISTFTQENFSGNTVIRSFVRQYDQMDRFYDLNEDYMQKNLSFARIQAAFHPSLMAIIGLGTLLVLIGGGKLVIEDVISIGDFTAFMLYLGILIWPSIALGWVIGLFQQGAASMKRIREILDSQPDIIDGEIAQIQQSIRGEIEFRNLTFAYDDTPVLHNVNLKIEPKTSLGILGPTGSGKTTLVRLIPHFFPLQPGTLYIDGKDINDYQLNYLRESIGFVTQEAFLFSDSIHNNIAFARPDATREEVETAAKISGIHDDILQLPEGYDSVLGERGINLSGGQKQRTAIARAILRQPRILILDDAFSALDTITEERILGNLKDILPDITVILISHRISTLQNTDSIIVIDDGKIVQSGSHEELSMVDGLYSKIYHKQLLEKEIESVE